MRSDVITLISETPEAHGIFDIRTESERVVFCCVKSVGFREYFQALAQSLHPSFVFVLRDYAEYQGEKICVYHNTRYRIIRTYVTPQQTIELTVEEATVDMAVPVTTEEVATT